MLLLQKFLNKKFDNNKIKFNFKNIYQNGKRSKKSRIEIREIRW
jgi:hypothetical protein